MSVRLRRDRGLLTRLVSVDNRLSVDHAREENFLYRINDERKRRTRISAERNSSTFCGRAWQNPREKLISDLA